MRLLVVTHYFWPENFRINDLVAELAARGHEVTVLTGPPSYPAGKVFTEYSADPDRFAAYCGARIVRVPVMARGRNRLGLLLNYVSAALSASILGPWKLRRLGFDAILIYQPSPVTTGIPGIVMSASKCAPAAMWVLDLWPETLQAVGAVRSRALLRAISWVVTFIYRRCQLIMAQSRSFVPMILNRCPGGPRVEYFPSWAEPMFTACDVDPASEVPISSGTFNVMFAGNIGEAQDFPAVLAAAELLREDARIRWLIVGDGSMAQWVREQVARRGLEGSVLMLGQFAVQRMPSFYRHADALLVSLKDQPLFDMTIPGKLQSYLAAGVPVIAMLNGEGAEVVRRSGAGLTCPAGDSTALAAAVSELASMPDETLMSMRRNALAVSAAEFDRRVLIGQVERWLLQLASDAPRSRQ